MSELQAAVARQAESSQSSSSPSEEEAAKLRSELSRRREAATAAAAECNMLRTEAKQAEKKAEGMAEELLIVYFFVLLGKHFISHFPHFRARGNSLTCPRLTRS